MTTRDKFLLWRFLPILILLALMGIAHGLGLTDYLAFEELKEHRETIQGWIQKHPFVAPISYILIYTLSISLSLPGGAFLSIIGGFLFGQPMSLLYVVTGATIGASIIFLAARTALGDLFKQWAGDKLQKMRKGFQEDAAGYLLFLRLVPLFPFWLVNIAPAFFGIPMWTYVWTTFVGIIPGAFVFTQAGVGLGSILDKGETLSLNSIFTWEIKIALIALGLFALIPTVIKKIRKNNSTKTD